MLPKDDIQRDFWKKIYPIAFKADLMSFSSTNELSILT